jgi:hypothetical protein
MMTTAWRGIIILAVTGAGAVAGKLSTGAIWLAAYG